MGTCSRCEYEQAEQFCDMCDTCNRTCAGCFLLGCHIAGTTQLPKLCNGGRMFLSVLTGNTLHCARLREWRRDVADAGEAHETQNRHHPHGDQQRPSFSLAAL